MSTEPEAKSVPHSDPSSKKKDDKSAKPNQAQEPKKDTRIPCCG